MERFGEARFTLGREEESAKNSQKAVNKIECFGDSQVTWTEGWCCLLRGRCGGRREEAVTNEGGDPVKSPEVDGNIEETKEQMIKARK